MKRFRLFETKVEMVVVMVLMALLVAGVAWASWGDSLLKTRYDISATVDEINKMDGVTATTDEINYIVGVTSALQTQLDAISAGTGTTLADTKIFIGNSAGTSVPVLISGDSGVTNAGVWTNNKIENTDVAFGSPTDAYLQVATDAGGGSWVAVPITDHALANSGAFTHGAKGQVIMMGGSLATTAGSATNTVTNNNITNSQLLFMSYSTTNDTDSLVTATNSDHSVLTYVLSADPSTVHTLDYVGIANNPDVGSEPWQIIGAFNSTSAGGDATETVAVSGSLTTDLVIVALEDDGTNDVTIAAARVSASGTVTLTLSADPSTDAIMSGIVVRPHSTSDAATHEIAYAVSTTTAGGAAVEAITATGVLSTDIIIAVQSTKQAQTLEFCVATADTVTCTFDADPGADEVISWMALRAL